MYGCARSRSLLKDPSVLSAMNADTQLSAIRVAVTVVIFNGIMAVSVNTGLVVPRIRLNANTSARIDYHSFHFHCSIAHRDFQFKDLNPAIDISGSTLASLSFFFWQIIFTGAILPTAWSRIRDKVLRRLRSNFALGRDFPGSRTLIHKWSRLNRLGVLTN